MESKQKLQFVASYHDNLGLSVYNCGFQKCDPLYAWGPALRNHHLIHFVAKGKGQFYFRGKEYLLSEETAFYAPAGEMIYYQADEQDPWEYYWVGFNGMDAARLLKAAGISAEEPCFSFSQPQEVMDRMLAIYQANGSSLENEAEMVGYLYLFFSFMIRQSHSGKKVFRRQSQYLDTATRFIERNYALPISVNEIAASAAISRSHLYRIFIQELGITPNEYLTQFRIANACDLLRSRDITVGEVAFSCGFSDPLYFSRVFKKAKGISPRAYARLAFENEKRKERSE